jgi:hypothetical protein
MRTVARKGSKKAIQERLPYVASAQALAGMGDDRYLAAIANCVMRACGLLTKTPK